MNEIICEKCQYKSKCEKDFCMRDYKLNYYFDRANIPVNKKKKMSLRIDQDGSDQEAFTRLSNIESNIVSFVNNGNNLYIYSENVGNGKTSWSYRLSDNYIKSVWFKKAMKPIVLFISVPRFLIELKSNISAKSDYISKLFDDRAIFDADLVVWDDIGSKAGTEYEVSNLLSIIDSRIASGKSNIYTSNLNNQELHQLLGDRLYSRIYNASEVIHIVGKDKRGINL